MIEFTGLPYDKAINTQALHENLAAILGSRYQAISTGPGFVYLFVDNDTLTEEERVAVQLVIETHDPSVLTPGQAQEVARQEARLAAIRRFLSRNFVSIADDVLSLNPDIRNAAHIATAQALGELQLLISNDNVEPAR